MGDEGYMYVLDAMIVKQYAYYPTDDFVSAHLRNIFGREIWTIYYDDDSRDLYCNDVPDRTIDDYYEIGAVIDEWVLWKE